MKKLILLITLLISLEAYSQDTTYYRVQLKVEDYNQNLHNIEAFREQRQAGKAAQLVGMGLSLVSVAIKDNKIKNGFAFAGLFVFTTGFVVDFGAGKKLER